LLKRENTPSLLILPMHLSLV